MHEDEALLREHGRQITEIIEATRDDPEDPEVREEVAAALACSLKEEENSRGTRSIEDTDLYRLAQAIRRAVDERECAILVKQAFPAEWSIIFEKYDFNWKFSCRNVEAPMKTTGDSSGIKEEIEELEETVKELDEHVVELAEEIRKHEEK